jgi:hypothetical protein
VLAQDYRAALPQINPRASTASPARPCRPMML